MCTKAFWRPGHSGLSVCQCPVNRGEASAARTSVQHLRHPWRKCREGFRTWWAKCDEWTISPTSSHPADRKCDSLPVSLTAPSSCFGTESDPRSCVLWFHGETFNPYEESRFLAPRQRALIHNCVCVLMFVPSCHLSSSLRIRSWMFCDLASS